MKNRLITVLISICMILLIFIIYHILIFDRAEQKHLFDRQIDNKWLIFRRQQGDGIFTYNIVQLNGSNQQFLGEFTGSPAFSNNNKFFAVGCLKDIENICIYQTNAIPNRLIYPVLPLNDVLYRPLKEISKLAVPSACIAQIETNDKFLQSFGVSSLSWSNDDKKILFLCVGNKRSEVCQVNLDGGKSDCWPNSFPNQILNAEWSPVAEEIVLSSDNFGPLIITNPLGKIIRTFGDGTGATWSPGGERLAFVAINRSINNGPDTGLAVINKDGNGFKWLISPQDVISNRSESFSFELFDSSLYRSKISWSADGDYLALNVRNPNMFSPNIFIYSFLDGKMRKLFDPHFGGRPYDPDWGQFHLQGQ